MNEQQHLFDPTTTRERTAGEKSFDEFLDDPAVGYHASFRSDWGLSPSHHFGTLGTAALHLESKGNQMKDSPLHRSKYMDPSFDPEWSDADEEDEDTSPLVGRIHARKLNPAQFQSTDAHANAADAAYRVLDAGEESFEVPGSITDSFMPKELAPNTASYYPRDAMDDVAESEHPTRKMAQPTRRAYGALSRGEAVSYRNNIESDPFQHDLSIPNISHVASSHGQRTWEQDVLSDPNASTTKKDFALQRQIHGTASTVPIPRLTREKVHQPELHLDQSQLNNRGETTYLERPPSLHMSKQFDIPGQG